MHHIAGQSSLARALSSITYAATTAFLDSEDSEDRVCFSNFMQNVLVIQSCIDRRENSLSPSVNYVDTPSIEPRYQKEELESVRKTHDENRLHEYRHSIDSLFVSLQELRLTYECTKQEVLKTKDIIAKELHNFGVILEGLIYAAQNYMCVLEENRKLYNEVQDLKGTLKFAERVSGVELGAAHSNIEGRNIRELMEQIASLKDDVARKDEEIGRLRFTKNPGNSERRGISSPRYISTTPRRQSLGASRPSQRSATSNSCAPKPSKRWV